VYVSSSEGDDGTAEVGNPALPFETIAEAKNHLRDGFPDWLLLKRGDTWYESLGGWGGLNGRSAAEPIVVATYGDSTVRPQLRTGIEQGIGICCGEHANLVFLGIDLYAHTRDPDSGEFTGPEGAGGVRRCCAGGGNLLIEDCSFRFYTSIVLQTGTDGVPVNIEFRRNLVADNYSTDSHSQGVYAHDVDGLLIEENIFDHNGWNETVAGAEATMFNHNTYINSNDVVMRGNMFLRASSMGNKFRSDETDGFVGLVLENNLYVEGEIGIGVGGNTDEPLRFRDVTIHNNVLLHIGRSSPTGRDFAWYLGESDVNGGVISNNLFLHQPLWNNAYAIHLGGGSETDIEITNNIIYGIQGRSLIVDATSNWNNIAITHNTIQDPEHETSLVDHSGTFDAVTYADNTYFTGAALSFARVDGQGVTYDEWLGLCGESGSSNEQVTFADPNRNVATYHESIGGEPTFQAFIDEARKQSKYNWRVEYTAAAVNDYIRAGFQRP
jgi:hypothetical protein